MAALKLCSQCQEAGKTSRVIPHGGMRTLMAHSAFYDEGGIYHYHDPNRHAESFSCSEGHRWNESTLRRCPAPGCDYGSD